MKSKFLLSIFIFFVLYQTLVYSQIFSIKASPKVIDEERMLSSFTGIDVYGDIELVVYEGDFKVIVSANDNLMKYIKTEVINSTLKISTKSVRIRGESVKRVQVYLPSLKSIDLSGACKAEIVSPFSDMTSRLDLNVNGDSQLDGTFEYAKTFVTLSGESEVTIIGNTDLLRLTVSGDSNFSGDYFISKDADIIISGESEVTVKITNTLQYDIDGESELIYYGEPSITQAKSNGLSQVKKL